MDVVHENGEINLLSCLGYDDDASDTTIEC